MFSNDFYFLKENEVIFFGKMKTFEKMGSQTNFWSFLLNRRTKVDTNGVFSLRNELVHHLYTPHIFLVCVMK